MRDERLKADDKLARWRGLADALRALSNPRRIHLLQYLREPRSAEDVAKEIGTARQTAIEHLQHLVDAGLVERTTTQRGRSAVIAYRWVPQRLFMVYEELGHLGLFEHATTDPVRHATMHLDDSIGAKEEALQARLLVVRGMRVGRILLLRGNGPWLIGRESSARLVLDYDPYVSGRHAEIHKTLEGHCLVDAFSSNGTYIDGRRVPRGDKVPIDHGTMIEIGRTAILFRTR